MAISLRSFATFYLILQLSVSSLAFAMEEQSRDVNEEIKGGQGVIRVAPVPSSCEVKQLLENAAVTCITLQNTRYALMKLRHDLNLCENPQLQRPEEFYTRMELNLNGKRMDDSSYGSDLRKRIQLYEKDEGDSQKYYAAAMEKLYPHETALIASLIDRKTPTDFRYLADSPVITIKQNTAQVYKDYLEMRISKGDTAALLLKLEGLENGTLGFEKDQNAAAALRRDLIDKGLLKEEKKVEVQNVASSVSSAVKAALSEVEALSATHHTLFDIKNFIKRMGGRVVVTTRKKKRFFKIDVTLLGQHQTFSQQGNKRTRKKQLKEQLKGFIQLLQQD